jgi:hypothetical protein
MSHGSRRTAHHGGPRAARVTVGLVLCLAAASGCADWFDSDGADTGPATDDGGQDIPTVVAGGVGAGCTGDPECREGLACRGGECVPAGDRGADRRCILSAECAGPGSDCPAGLNCGWFGFCACAGDGEAGDACTSSSDCAKGLTCTPAGFAGHCARPDDDAGDVGASCDDNLDCMAGLVCSTAGGTCVAGSLLMNPDLFAGVACPDETALPFGVRSRIPRPDDGPDADFYGMPFPTDVRRTNDGRLDLSAHPTPGGGVFGIDPLNGVLRAIEADLFGFSVNAAVFFRFTGPVDLATLTTAADPDTGAPPTVRFVNLDDPTEDIPAFVRFSADRNKYVCPNHLVVHPGWAHPLRPSTTYAVIVTRAVRGVAPAGQDGLGEPAAALDDLPALLSSTRPDDASLQRAWDAHAPLRAYLTGGPLAPGDVAGVALFTTGDPTAPMRAFRDFFHPGGDGTVAADLPTLSDLVACGDGEVAACLTPGWDESAEGKAGQPDPRACPATLPAGFTEFHARIRLPVFQEGDPPFAGNGGAVRFVAGAPSVVRYEDVCAAIAIPDGEIPESGWPLVIYGHGTGGSFRSGMGAAAEYAGLGIATLSIDQAMHGPRRGAELDPGPLFYNFGNPPAARGNLLQGAADNFSLVRFARAFDGVMGTLEVRFDPDRIAYQGHSQGATTGPLFVPYEDGLRGAVFTGAGGSLVYGLLGKKLPYDASVGIKGGLQEMHVDDAHPALHLIQWYFDGTDPMLHGPAMIRAPDGDPLHVLNVVGWDDSYTPWRTGLIFAASMGGTLLYHFDDGMCWPGGGCGMQGFSPGQDLGMDQVRVPVDLDYGGNVEAGAGDWLTVFTLGSLSDGTYDGHFVGDRNPATHKALLQFVRTLLAPEAKAPTVRLDTPPCPDAETRPCVD